LSRGIEFPLTHDIEQLLEIAETRGLALPEGVREARLLTPYAVGMWLESNGIPGTPYAIAEKK